MVSLPARTVWRGNPQSVDHAPDISQVAAWAENLETVATSSIAYIDGTLTALQGRAGTANGEFALVIAEGTTGGVYERVAGTWTKIAALPSLYTESLSSLAAEAAQVAAEAARDVALTYRNSAAADAASAAAEAAQAQAAAEASGSVVFYDTFAAADAAKGGLSEGQVVEVYADETRSGARVRYALESAALVYKYTFDSVLTDVPFIPTIQPAFATAFRDGAALDPRLTFVRSTVTTRRNSVGLLEAVAANIPAHQFAYDGTYLGVAAFPAFEQQIPTVAINDLNAASFDTSNAVVVSDAIAGPDGVTMADKLRLDATSSATHFIWLDNKTYTADEAYTVSFFAKAAELSWVRVVAAGATPVNFAAFHVNLATGETTNGAGGSPADDVRIQFFANGWVRICVSFVQDVTTSVGDVAVYLSQGGAVADATFATADGTSGVYLSGFNKTQTPIPMPYHPLAETRAADFLSSEPGRIGHRDVEGAAVVEFLCEGIGDQYAAIYYGNVSGSSTHGVAMYASSGTNVVARWRDASEEVPDSSSYGSGFGVTTRAGVSWSPSGVLAMQPMDPDLTPTAGVAAPVTTEVWFGLGVNTGSNSNSQALCGYIRTITVWSRAIEPTELRSLVERGYVDQRASRMVSPEVISINRDSVIRANDIISGDIDTAQKAAALQAALTAAAGRTFEWNTPYGQASRPYNITDRSLASFVMPTSGRIVGSDGAVVDCSGIANSGTVKSLFRTGAALQAGYALTADADRTTDTVELAEASVTALAPYRGKWLQMNTNDLFIAGGVVGANEQGELVKVRSWTADTITFYEPLMDSYAVASGARLRPITGMSSRLQFQGLQAIGCGQFSTDTTGDRMFNLLYVDHLLVEDCDSKFFDNGNYFYAVVDSHVLRNTVEFDAPNGRTANQYGLCYVGPCWNTSFEKNTIRGGKHGIVQSGGASAPGVSRHVDVVRNTISGTWNVGISQHTNAEYANLHYNKILGCNGGVEGGCRHVTSIGNRITALPDDDLGVGIYVTDVAEYFTSQGDIVEGGRFGFRMDNDPANLFAGSVGPKEIKIADFKCSGFSQAGVMLDTETGHPGSNIMIPGLITREAGGAPSGVTAAPSIKITGPFGKVRITDADLQAASGNTSACIITTGISDGRVRGVDYSGHSAPSLGGTDVTSADVAAY